MKSRRSFMQRAAVAVMMAKTSTLRVLGVVDDPTRERASTWYALSLMRAFNVLQVQLKAENQVGTESNHTHYWAPRPQMLRGLSLQSVKAANDPRHGAFWRSLAPDEPNGEVISGWTLDFFLKPDNAGYIHVLAETLDPTQEDAIRAIFVSDEWAVIYRGTIAGKEQPAANSLSHARDFPGVLSHDHYARNNQPSFIEKGARLLKVAAFSLAAPLMNCPANNCYPPPSSSCYNCCKCQKPVGCGLECHQVR
jgi:hypothetical protein